MSEEKKEYNTVEENLSGHETEETVDEAAAQEASVEDVQEETAQTEGSEESVQEDADEKLLRKKGFSVRRKKIKKMKKSRSLPTE